MSYLEYKVQTVPTGARKILHANWALLLLLAAVAGVGFLMLTSVAGGDPSRWAEPQAKRFLLGLAIMMIIVLRSIRLGLWSMLPNLLPLLVLGGLLGGFTTYSAFALFSYELLDQGRLGVLTAQIGLHLTVGIACAAGGMMLGRALFGSAAT